METAPDKSWIGKTIRELELRSRYGANVIALRRGDDIIIPPEIDTPLDNSVTLVMLGSYELFDRLRH